MTANAAPPTTGRVIAGIGWLDWHALTGPEDLAGITLIRDVAVLLIPDDLAGALARIPMQDVGTVVSVPRRENVRVLAGQVTLTGESLADVAAGGTLILLGQTFITTPVAAIAYDEIRLFGMLHAPRGSEHALGAKLVQMNGQVFYYPAPEAGTDLRRVLGEERISREYLEALPRPIVLVANGSITFDEDVPVSLLCAKVRSMMLVGSIRAPRPLVPTLMALTPDRIGSITGYPAGAWIMLDSETLGREDFELMASPTPLYISGQVTLADDVSAEMVRANVPEIVLLGVLRAPKALHPLLRSITTERRGLLLPSP